MAQTIQRSFTGGEIAPGLRSRADLTKYTTGLALCENFFVRVQGGVYNRPGTRFVGEIADSTQRARLIGFSFNVQQTYILVFEHLRMRVIRDGAFVLDGAGPALFELTTPYTQAQLARLQVTQSADVMTIVHPDHAPRNLSRTADDAWSLDIINYGSTLAAPTWPAATAFAITAITQAARARITTATPHGLVTGNAVTITQVTGMTEINGIGSVITVISSTVIQLDSVDSTMFSAYVSGGFVTRSTLVPIGTGAGDFDKTYSYVVTAMDADGVESLASPQQVINTPSLSQTAAVRLRWLPVTGAVSYRVYKDPSNATGVYGWIGDSNNTTFDDFNIAPITSDAPPEDRQPFSGSGNNPAAVNYFQQRQVYANTNNEPQAVYTTQTNNFNSLRTSTPARADDAITFTIVGREVNEIRHILSLDSMILLTSGGEWRVTEGQDRVLTPDTIGVRIQSYNGADYVPPVVINSTALYLQEKGSRIRDLAYSFNNDSYTGNDLSIMSEHLFEGFEIQEMAYADEPYGILWCVRNDGVLLGLTYQREHQVWAWHKHTTDGAFESVEVITEDDRDAVYIIVRRTIEGQTRRFVERIEPRIVSSPEDAFYVDSGLSYDGTPITNVSGLDHLEGEQVAVLADGNEVTGLTVSQGAITLPRASSKVHVGLPYTAAIETLDVDIASNDQSLKGQEISISRVILEVESSRGGFIGPKNDDGTTGPVLEIKPRFDSDGYGAIALRTFKTELLIEPQWGKGGGIRIEQRSPLPLAILSVIPEVDIGGS